MERTTGYGWAQIGLHWAIALLILANYLISDGMERALDALLEGGAVTAATPTVHVYVGLAVLVLALVRLGVRIKVGAPVQAGQGLLDKAAEWVHRLLFLLMILVPVLGATAWYAGVDAAGDLHVLAINAMMLLVLAHSATALFHQFVLKDGLLLQMLRTR